MNKNTRKKKDRVQAVVETATVIAKICLFVAGALQNAFPAQDIPRKMLRSGDKV